MMAERIAHTPDENSILEADEVKRERKSTTLWTIVIALGTMAGVGVLVFSMVITGFSDKASMAEQLKEHGGHLTSVDMHLNRHDSEINDSKVNLGKMATAIESTDKRLGSMETKLDRLLERK